MKNIFKTAKVGQKVYSLQYGTGRVSRNSGDDFSVLFLNVRKRERIIVCYNYNGKIQAYNYNSNRDLYFKKPVIISKERLSTLNADSFGDGIDMGAYLENILPTMPRILPKISEVKIVDEMNNHSDGLI